MIQKYNFYIIQRITTQIVPVNSLISFAPLRQLLLFLTQLLTPPWHKTAFSF